MELYQRMKLQMKGKGKGARLPSL